MRIILLAIATSVMPVYALADEDPMDRLQQIQDQIEQNRDKLELQRQRGSEVAGLLQDSERKRAAVVKEIRDLEREMKALQAKQLRLEGLIKSLQRDLEATRREASQGAAWSLAIARGGTMEMMLQGASPADRIRQNGLLRSTLESLEGQALDILANLERQQLARTDLEQSIARQDVVRRQLAARLEESQAREQQLRKTLDMVRKDEQMTLAMVGDLESARADLTRIISSSRRGRRELLALDPWKGSMEPPVDAPLMMEYGRQKDPVFGVQIEHPGWTYKVPVQTPVVAVAPGEVAYAGWLRGYGNLVVLQHGGEYFTLYGYMDELLVATGDYVAESDPIGFSGNTGSLYGPALHFEIRHRKDPLDPADWVR